MIQSDGQSATNPDDQIVQYVGNATSAATYFLEVQGIEAAAGAYALSTPVRAGGRCPISLFLN